MMVTRPNSFLKLIVLLLFLGSSAGCSTLFAPDTQDRVHVVSGFEPEFIEVDSSLEPDPEVAAFIQRYAVELNRVMNRRITVSRGVIERGQPESPLGNLTADILRFMSARELGQEVDIAILNRGGLRIPIPEGNVTVGTMYELMPFENHITLLRFNGRQIQQLALELAIEGGEPVSGLRMRIVDGRPTDILINDDRIRPERSYWVATNNWLADGGGPLPTLWQPLERIDTEVLIRDAFIEYLNTLPYIEPRTDGRIRR